MSVVIFTESGERLIVCGRNYSSVVVFDTDTCDVHLFIPLHTPAPHCVCDLGQELCPSVCERQTDACEQMGHSDIVKRCANIPRRSVYRDIVQERPARCMGRNN